MEKEKPVFEVPKLVTLDGKEITEDRLLNELEIVAGNSCGAGTGDGNTCSRGSNP
jgi:hypothetical protein